VFVGDEAYRTHHARPTLEWTIGLRADGAAACSCIEELRASASAPQLMMFDVIDERRYYSP
jgi:hypothetical protein